MARGSPRIDARPAPRPARRASAITRWPPATSVSLLAVATTLPARSAASVGRRDTTPPVPTTTRSTSSRVASSTSASSPRDPRGARRQVERCAVVRERDRGGAEAARPAPRARPRCGPWRGRRPGTGRRAPRGPRPPGGRCSRSSRAGRRRAAGGQPARATDIQRDHRARRTGTSRSGRACRRGPGSAARSPSAPAARLSIDSARSPACAASPSSGPRTSAPSGSWPSAASEDRGHHASWRRARRSAPSIDLAGEMWVRNLWRPIWRPTRKAPVS